MTLVDTCGAKCVETRAKSMTEGVVFGPLKCVCSPVLRQWKSLASRIFSSLPPGESVGWRGSHQPLALKSPRAKMLPFKVLKIGSSKGTEWLEGGGR